ncbi:MAG: hypothetical protein RIQ60_3566 [Pseudomonadota bacterium]|jgi:hypothetical protein
MLPVLTLACTGAAARAEGPPTFAPVAPPPLLVGGAPSAEPQRGEGQPAVAGAAPALPPVQRTAVVSDRTPAQAGNTSVSVEPGVRSTVIEDGGARIEELSVRGAVRSIHVAPKGVGAAYEVLPSVGPGGPRDSAPGPSTPRSSAGQRVWPLFSF